MKLLEDILIRESGEIVLTEKLTVGNSIAIERRSLFPGDDYSQELEKVKLICQLVHSETYLSIPVPAPPNPPQWNDFSDYMLSDPMFKGYRDIVRPIDGDLNSALFDGYEMVDTKGVGAFSLVWGVWVSVSGITQVDRETIADVAEGFNLPGDFVGVIRGA